MDWRDLQTFLATAEAGSTQAASETLGLDQSTISRRIAAFEKTLGHRLFERLPTGLVLTNAGERMLATARQVDQDVHSLERGLIGQDMDVHGEVRLTVPPLMLESFLYEILGEFHAQHPDVHLDIDVSYTEANLTKREADIAVRMYRPAQMDLISRYLGDVPLCFCAAKSYLDRKGRPKTPEELFTHDLVGFDANQEIIKAMREKGWPACRDSFATRCDLQSAYWELIRAGCGIGFSQVQVAQADPDVEILPLDVDIPILPVWLAAPQAMRQTPRIRRVWDLLAEGLKAAL